MGTQVGIIDIIGMDRPVDTGSLYVDRDVNRHRDLAR